MGAEATIVDGRESAPPSDARMKRFVRKNLPITEELRRLPKFVRDYAGDALHHQRAHGDVFVRRVGTPSVYLCHPDLMRWVLRTNVRNYRKGPDYELLRPVFGNGVFVSEGDLWTRQRRLLAPEFRPTAVARFLPLILDELEGCLATWPTDEPLDVGVATMDLTIRVIGRAMYRADFSSLTREIASLLEACLSQSIRQIVSMGLLRPWMPTPGNLRARAAERRLTELIVGLIEAAEQRRDSEPDGPGIDLLSRMLVARDPDTGEAMDRQQLIDEAKSMLLAGTDTTSLALSWAVYLLSHNLDCRARLIAEVDAVLGGRAATVDDVPRLVYTRQVLLESLRLRPSVPAVTRQALADDDILGVKVAKGESVTLPIYVVHRHPDFWDAPDVFDPERFRADRVDAIEPYSYLPFLRGRRACLGEHFAMLEGVVALATIYGRFEVERVDVEDIEPRPISTLHMRRPLRVWARPRVVS